MNPNLEEIKQVLLILHEELQKQEHLINKRKEQYEAFKQTLETEINKRRVVTWWLRVLSVVCILHLAVTLALLVRV